VELLVVLAVIGIILAFILKAATDSVRRAEERATQTLITKIETGLSDRLEALLLQRADANDAHAYLAALWNANEPANPLLNGARAVLQENRAQVIAQVDRLKAEMPDVFVVQGGPAGVGMNYYPLNFAAAGYPGTAYSSGIAAFDAHAPYFYPVITPSPEGDGFSGHA
jgi:type II secretory pathway pseudopilin PulG